MHIALVTTYPPSQGTLNEYGLHFANALANNSKVSNLSIVADIYKTSSNPETDNTNNQLNNIYRVWKFNSLTNAWKINKMLNMLEPDAVIFNIQFATFGDKRIPGALGLLAPWLSSRKRTTVTLLHNIVETVDLKVAGFGSNPLMNAITMIAGRFFTTMILRSNLVALTMPRYVKIIQEKYGAKNVVHIPHGSFPAPNEIKPLPDQPTVMTFGKFGTYKKVEVLLEAHARLLEHNKNIQLVIAGRDSPNAQGYLAKAQENYKHLPNVTFTGYVPEEKVAEVFENSTVVVFPYEITTGSSGVLHQTGQYARAAVMPKIGDLADLVEEEGYQASFFEPNNVESLTAAIWNLLSNTEKARDLGLVNHKAAIGLTIDEVANRYIQKIQILQEQQ